MIELAIVNKILRHCLSGLASLLMQCYMIKLQVYPCPAEPVLCFSENNEDPDQLASDEAI